MEFGCNLLRYLLDSTHGLDIEFLRRELDGGIARMHASKLDMLRDGISHNLALVGHCIHFDFLGTLDEARDDHRMLLAHIGSHLEEAHQLVLI